MNKKWKINDTQTDIAEKIANEFNISRLVANIIANKGLKDKKEIVLNSILTDSQIRKK